MKGKGRTWRWVLAGIMSIWLLGGVVIPAWTQTPKTAPQVSTEALKQMQQQLELQRKSYDLYRDRLLQIQRTVQSNLNILQYHVQLTDQQVKTLENQIQTANQQLTNLQASLSQAANQYQIKRSATIARLRVLQRQHLALQGWQLLLKSKDLNQFLDRRFALKRLYQADQTRLLALKDTADRLQLAYQQIEQQKNQVLLLQQRLLAQQSQYKAQATVQNQLMERLNRDRQALEAADSQLQEDSKGIGVLIRDRLAAQNKAILRPEDYKRGNGFLYYPSDGSLSSNFGWRTHPILGTRRFHAGIDFAASYGSTIRAARQGEVIFAGWYGGYGKAVIIDHGRGITTLYAHSSEIYVQEGQQVQAGQAIAAVGSTGFSTGPHLHFEVRANGEPVNPLEYL